MLELLSPAGSPEAVRAAVQSGADAVYLGYGNFNARRNAVNFDEAALQEAVQYCHLRGVKVYLTLNTLLNDRELTQAAKLVDQVSQMGVDALLVQDLGVARMCRQVAPDLPLHASTQMTIHSLDGAKAAADLGMTRVVVSRELSRDQIAYLCDRSPVEIECFVHGALCMCYSGQCFFSSVIGGRSGNRGMCAQPCRLNYGWGQTADKPLLSLKDMSLAKHLQELEEMGVACAKIEGRMKRPEYVAVVTKVYATAIREHRDPTPGEQQALAHAFSRQGFTDGYFMDKTGRHMFGIREKTPVPTKLFAAAKGDYSKEHPTVPVKLYALVAAGEPVQVAAEDADGHIAKAEGPVPEAARKISLAREQVEEQIGKTGGTPYRCERALAQVDEGLSLPLSVLNGLRRTVLDNLTSQRITPPERRQGAYHPGVRYENQTSEPVLTLSLHTAEQFSQELLDCHPHSLALPLDEWIAHPELVETVLQADVEPALVMPRVFWDRERSELELRLRQLHALGLETAYVSTLAGIRVAQRNDYRCRGDFGLGVYNAQSIREYKRLGLTSVVLSFEQRMAQIRDLSKAMDCEAIVYGRLPLMITENCIIHNRFNGCGCQSGFQRMVDRKGAYFPVARAFGCRNEIFNSRKLFLADKAKDYERAGLWGVRLLFTTENSKECLRVVRRYQGEGTYAPNEFTRGLYYRGVD